MLRPLERRLHATRLQRQRQGPGKRDFTGKWRNHFTFTVIHPRLAALGVPSEVRGPSGIVNTSWDRLPAFCMWDLLFCVLCRCRTFYSYSGLSAPDIVALLTTAMPPQGFSGSQGSDGDYHWTGYEQ